MARVANDRLSPPEGRQRGAEQAGPSSDLGGVSCFWDRSLLCSRNWMAPTENKALLPFVYSQTRWGCDMYAHIVRLNRFLERLDRLRFILVMLLADFSLAVIIVLPLAQIVDMSGPTLESAQKLGLSQTTVIVHSLLIAPVFETWLGQSLPFSILYRLNVKDPAGLIGVSATWFGLQHALGLTIAAFIPHFLPGIILAYTFWRWRKLNYANAFWMTAAVHVSMNVLAIVLELAQ